VDDSVIWEDPLELRIRLDIPLERIAVLEAEIADLRASTVRKGHQPLLPALAAPTSSQARAPAHAGVLVDQSSSPEEKLALFRDLFSGRSDVYAVRWTSAKSGKSGWSPAERDPFGGRERPDHEREFLPLTPELLARHLARTGGDASRQDSRQRGGKQSMACQAGARSRRIWRCLAACQHFRTGI